MIIWRDFILKILPFIAPFLLLVSCGGTSREDLVVTVDKLAPEVRSEIETDTAFDFTSTLCAYASVQKEQGLADENTRDYLAKQFRKRGLNRRDIDVLFDTNSDFGTGMSFNGLSCSIRYGRVINRAFYPGIGHQWQYETGSGGATQYVYLQGNGEPSGMIVTSWN